ncbi:sensor histidine kinase [Paenibacillus eucommiae]|uniref:Two-component system sensor histidine kinase YesM n=1 Tax=Paenibacillus eucommiae TaxID=1355755 RepID=A0ABS4IXQ9_9BACL|nr:sensor histidine kinase [Paenibacillus eucommiae]MBP1991676.1 two-component system sensor histidine kinase YesM [Paenibacillus eucommiae]
MKDRAGIWFYIRHFKIHSIFLRNFLIIVCLVTLPVVSMSAAVYYVYNKVIKEEVGAVHLIALSRLRDMVDMTFREIDDFSLQIASDEAVTRLIEEPHPEQSNYTSYKQIQSLSQKITPANKISGQFINSIYLFSETNGYVLASNLGLWKLEWFMDNGWESEYNLRKANSNYWMLNRTAKMYIGENEPRQLLSLFYTAPLGKKGKGAVIVNIDTERLGKFINNVSDNYLEDIYIVDKNGTVIYNRDPSLLNTNISTIDPLQDLLQQDETQPIKKSVNGKIESITYLNSQFNDWRFISVIPLRLYQEKDAYLRNYMFVIFAGGLVIALLLAWLIAARVFQPIRKIISIVENPDKWTSVELGKQEPHLNEIRQIAATLIKSHGQRLELELELRHRLSLLKKAQNVALQSQINPHFLYNTLETINWNAIRLTGGENKVTEMLTSLSRLLRLSLESPTNLIPIKAELEHVQHYIDILLIRYKKSFSIVWEIDDAILSCQIPKITLQPLIENAIYHGIKPKQGQGIIRISGCMADGHIQLEVADDGVGMERERMEEMNVAMTDDYSEPGDHIGIKNVNQRIKLTFGEPFGITIISEKHAGTVIRLILPAVEQ